MPLWFERTNPDQLFLRLMVELRHLIRQSAQRQENPSRKLCALLSALSGCIGSIDERKHRELIEAILDAKLLHHDTVTLKSLRDCRLVPLVHIC